MANTKVTGDLIASSTIATGNIADNAVTSDKISGITTAHITEGANLYYTDARADARAALLVDSAPSTLNTLNELAAALGDDPNFAATTAVSIGLKAPIASPSFTGNATFGGAVNIAGTLTLDQGSLLNGIINTPASLRINIDSNDNNIGEGFIVGHNQTNINNNNVLFKVEENGKVGIGTPSPDNILHIRNGDTTYASQVGADTMLFLETTNVSNALQFTSANTGQQYIMFGDDDPNVGWISYNHSDNNLNFRVNGSEKMCVTSTGNVGIGTSSPSEILHLNEAGQTGCFIRFQNTGGSGVYIGGRSEVMEMYTNGSEKMRITSGGNVGIGMTSPATRLDIGIGTLGNNGYGGIRIADDAAHFWMLIAKNSVGNRRLSLYHGQGSIPLVFQEGGGNVGIGTTLPGYKLDVAEKIRMIAGLKITPTTSNLYNEDGALSYYSSGNGVYLNGAGASGWLRLQGSGVENDRNSINIYGSAGDYMNFRTANSTRMIINSQGQMWLGGSYTGGGIANGNTAYMNNLNAGAFSILHRNSSDVYVHFNSYYTSSNTYVSKYSGRGFMLGYNAAVDNGFFFSKAPNTTAGQNQTFSQVMTVGYGTSNNVGIGITTPGAKLEVKGNFKIQRSTIAEASELTMEAGEFDIKAHSAYKIRFFTGGVERVHITTSGNLDPAADAAQNLGSTSKRWANIYTTDLHLSNKGKSNDVDNTWGDWTIQEGEEDLFLINNRSGKKYKFLLQKID